MSDSISGTIERVTFHNPENGFVVLRVHVKGMRALVTVVGQAARAVAGEYLEATGKWTEDSEHGAHMGIEPSFRSIHQHHNSSHNVYSLL